MKRYLSPLILLTASVIWGLAFSAQKAASAVPPLTLGAIRSIIATLFLLLLLPLSNRICHTGTDLSVKCSIRFTMRELLGGAILGAILAGASFLQQAGIAAGADASKSSFITSLYVVLVPIYALVLRKRARLNVWISVAIAVVGFYFMCIDGDFSISSAELTVLLCSLVFPLHILFIDYFAPSTNGIRIAIVQFAAAAVISAMPALIFESPIEADVIYESALPLLYLGVMSSGIAYTLQIIGQRGADPTASALILSLESVFGMLGAMVLLGEWLSTREYIGCATVFIAVILSQINFKRKDGKNAEICK